MKRKHFIYLLIILFISSMAFAQKAPDDFFGEKIGADKTLIIYPKIIEYLKHLDANSEKIKLCNEGLSTLNNPMYLIFISSEENIKNLPDLIEINKKLANPDQIDEKQANILVDKGKVFVLITGTIHSTEIASSQMSMLFAHKLATTDNPNLKKILDNVVVLFMPSINPDGNIMVTEWYNKYLNTPYEGGRMPYLYHHYAGHDTNRDFVTLNLKETKVVNSVLHHKYFPQIFLDMHQMGSTGPRMFVPPFKSPLNKNLSPTMINSSSMIGSYMAYKLISAGKKGVASAYGFDAYWIGGSKNTAWYKNIIGILTELASAKIATPIYVDHNELRAGSKGLPEYKRQVNFPAPWEGGWWRLKDIIEYEMIADEAFIEIASKNREYFLKNFYKMSKKEIEKGKKLKPHAYVVPLEQHDLPTTFTFLQKMKEHGVRLFKLKEDLKVKNKIYKKGSYIIPLDQPFRAFIVTAMEKQKYPDVRLVRDGEIIRPYDATGWTMPLQMGVKYYEINNHFDRTKLGKVNSINYLETKVENNQKDYYLITGKSNRSYLIINKLFKNDVNIYRAMDSNEEIYPGDFLIKTTDIEKSELIKLTKNSGLSNIRNINIDNIKIIKIKKPKIGIYQSYFASMDEGWTRWVLDNYKFDHETLHNKDIKDKNFYKKFDVLIIPDLPRTFVIGEGIQSRWYDPKSYPPEYRGGIEKDGIKNLIKMVKNGGSLILFDSAYQIAQKDFSLPIYNVLENKSRKEFFCPGSILNIKIDNKDPLGWGLPENGIIYFSRSPAFKTSIPSIQTIDRKVVARFKDRDPHLISGYIEGEKLLNRTVEIVRFKYHGGNVMVLGGRIQHRAQTYATFKFLFNSIYFPETKN